MILVVDCGTSFLKAALAEEDGSLRCTPVRIRLIRPESPGCWEQSLKKALEILDADRRSVSCIMITGHGPCAVAVTKDGKAPAAVLWKDAGQQASTPSFIPRILSLKNSFPEVWKDTRLVLGTAEYLSWVLTGNACAAMPAEGFESFYWDSGSLEKNGIDTSLLPPFMKSGEILGRTKQGIPVLVPCPDYIPAVIGSGAVRPGMLCLRSGTGDGINLCTDKPVYRKDFLTSRHPNGKDWNLSRIIPDTGLALAAAVGDRPWEKALEDEDIRRIAVQQCKRTAAAVKEIEDLGIKEIRISGGLSVNPVMNQMRADALGMPVSTVEGEETGLQGLAILAFCSLNNTDIAETTGKTVHIKETFYPSE